MAFVINEMRIKELINLIGSVKGVSEIIEVTTKKIVELYGIDRVSLTLIFNEEVYKSSATALPSYPQYFLPLSQEKGKLLIESEEFRSPLVLDSVDSNIPAATAEIFKKNQIKSLVVLPFIAATYQGFFELHSIKNKREWESGELSEIRLVIVTLEAVLNSKLQNQNDGSAKFSSIPELLSAFPGLSFFIDSRGIVCSVNDESTSYLEKADFKPLGKRFEKMLEYLVTAESKPIFQSAVLRVLAQIDNRASFNSILITEVEERTYQFNVTRHNDGVLVIGVPVTVAIIDETRLSQLKSSYLRLLETGNTVIFRTNASFSVTEVIGNSSRVFGIDSDRFLRAGGSLWMRLVHREELSRLKDYIASIVAQPREFAEEFRIIHQSTGSIRRMFGRGVPLFATTGELVGWEGITVDITDVRSAEEEVISQQQRIEALYEVARALQMNLDPTMVALKGLRALIKATNSSAGLVFFYDEKTDTLELSAAEGLGHAYVTEAEKLINGPSLARFAITNREGILVENIQEDPRAVVKIAKTEGLKATIVSPLIVGSKVLGAIVVFRRETRAFNKADFELVGAASNQIALATRQAELYANEKKQADFFAALYRLSHELSRHASPKEISHHAFKILHQELACKRMWLGVINEQGTHIVGQAGFGPGVRRRIVELQIELNADQNDLLNEALKQKEPLIIQPSETEHCTGLERVFERLNPGPFAVVPLVSLGQLVGVLVIEPSVGAGFFTPGRMSFLTSMANEVAVVFMANRFQSKLAEAEKMRMAGLFASGVAHNFNNMLQAILGQASLIELQLDKKSLLRDAVSVIKGAASRGAMLVRQLLSFSTVDTREKSHFSIAQLIEQSQDLYKTILGSPTELHLDITTDDSQIYADQGQIQQVLTNLLVNSKEAISQGSASVSISCTRIRLRSGEIDPELAPGDYLRIEVKDNGVGMNEDQRSRCFEPFYTTKNVDAVTGIGVTGSGLGLSTAYSILKQHDGLITVQSVVGEGSTFSLYLPAAFSATQLASQTLPKVYFYSLDPIQQITIDSGLDSLGIKPIIIESEENLYQVINDKNSSRIIILDADRATDQMADFIESASSFAPNLKAILLSFNPLRWKRAISDQRNLQVYDKPLAVWTLREVVKGMVGTKVRSKLDRQIDIIKDDTGHNVNIGTDYDNTASTKKQIKKQSDEEEYQ